MSAAELTVCFYVSVNYSARRRVTHICVGNSTIIGPDNGLSPGGRQAIIWTNAGILLIGPWGTNFSEILIGIQTFSLKKTRLKMSSAKWRPFCLGLNVLITMTCDWREGFSARTKRKSCRQENRCSTQALFDYFIWLLLMFLRYEKFPGRMC